MMGVMGLIMLVGLSIFVIVIVRSTSNSVAKSKRKNYELPLSDEAYSIGDDGEIIEYFETEFKRKPDFSGDNRINLP